MASVPVADDGGSLIAGHRSAGLPVMLSAFRFKSTDFPTGRPQSFIRCAGRTRRVHSQTICVASMSTVPPGVEMHSHAPPQPECAANERRGDNAHLEPAAMSLCPPEPPMIFP